MLGNTKQGILKESKWLSSGPGTATILPPWVDEEREEGAGVGVGSPLPKGLLPIHTLRKHRYAAHFRQFKELGQHSMAYGEDVFPLLYKNL